MKLSQKIGAALFGFQLLAIIFLGCGWIFNVVAGATHPMNEVTGMFILRCIGIVVAPLGGVLGFI